MGRGTRVKVTVALLTLALVAYFWLLGARAIALIEWGGAAGVALGIGVLLLPIIGAVLVFWELRFGWRTERLARRLAEQDLLPDDSDLARRPSGRVERSAADAHFEAGPPGPRVIPFFPYLVIGALAALFGGERILHAYLSWLGLAAGGGF